MTASSFSPNEDDSVQCIDRDHSWFHYALIMGSLSCCITVDILQYSMPLAFLPSVLEDRGHSPMNIATAIGSYYWAGFAGGLVVTSYQIWKFFYVKETSDVDVTPYPTVQRHIRFLIFGLGIGVVTLFIQALNPRWFTHTTCRFIQGFAGAYIFFYVFLLNVALFKGQQRVTAMTCSSCATVLAELVGPLLGSYVFDSYGQRAVFWFLGLVSFGNQALLFVALYITKPTDGPKLTLRRPEPAVAEPAEQKWWSCLAPQPGTGAKMKALLQTPTFVCAILIITMAGCVKGSVEEMLPFHADHQWGYDPVQIGQLFCAVAVTYFAAASLLNYFWMNIGRFQIAVSAQGILLLGVTAWMAFCVFYYTHDTKILFGAFAAYGFAAGLAFTAAAQLIADVVDHEEGQSKEVANGIWNTAWEAGGSTGFFLGGLLAHHHNEQMTLTGRFAVCSIVVAIAMVLIGGGLSGKSSTLVEGDVGYGSTA